jgi:hypothetical protein
LKRVRNVPVVVTLYNDLDLPHRAPAVLW